MSKIGTHLVSAFLLAVWMTPGAGALAVSLHEVLDHHHTHQNAECSLEIPELVQTASHGHRHQDDAKAAPDHDHEATIDGSGASPRPSVSSVVVAGSASRDADLSKPALDDGFLRRGPPTPLFTTHCALLL